MHVSGSPPWATEHAWGPLPGRRWFPLFLVRKFCFFGPSEKAQSKGDERLVVVMEFSNPAQEGGPCAWAPDGSLLASCDGNRLFVRDTSTLMLVQIFTNIDTVLDTCPPPRPPAPSPAPSPARAPAPAYPARPHHILTTCPPLCCPSDPLQVSRLEWSRDSKYVLCAMYKVGVVQVWDVDEPEWVCKIREGPAGLCYSQWSPEGRHILNTNEFNVRITVWALAQTPAGVVASLRAPKFCDRALDFSNDLSYLAVAERKNAKDYVQIYQCGTWVCVCVGGCVCGAGALSYGHARPCGTQVCVVCRSPWRAFPRTRETLRDSSVCMCVCVCRSPWRDFPRTRETLRGSSGPRTIAPSVCGIRTSSMLSWPTLLTEGASADSKWGLCTYTHTQTCTAGIRTCRVHTHSTHVYKYARAAYTHSTHVHAYKVYSTCPYAHTFSNLWMYIRIPGV